MRRTVGSMVAMALVAGCTFQSSCGKLDSNKLEKKIAEHFEKGTGVALDSVSCPDGVDMKEGDTFECTAKVGATQLGYTVTQKDAEGNVEWALRDGVVLSGKLEEQIAAELTKTGTAPKKVDCGERVRHSKPQSTFECVAIAPDDKRWRVGVTVKDTEGNVSYNVLGPEGGAATPSPATPE